MTSGWGLLLAELVPPATLVAWSPVKTISALALTLNSSRPKPTALALLAGWLIALATVAGLFLGAPDLITSVEHNSAVRRTWAGVGIVVGALLVIGSGYRWLSRGRARKSSGWWSTFTQISPPGAFALGVILPVAGPKVLAMCAAAGLSIGRASTSGVGTGLALMYFTALAGSPVIVAVGGYWLATEHVNRWLLTLRRTLDRHQELVTAGVGAAIGVVLVVAGLRWM